MRKQNVLALLLALALLLGAGPAARAANRMELVWENSRQEGKIYLDLRSVDQSVYGVQLELTLDGSYPACTFTPDSQRAYSPGCTVDIRQRQTDIVIYLTDTEPLNSRENFALGTLDLGVRETVRNAPASARITVLDKSLTGSAERISVAVTGSAEQDRPSRPDGTEQPDSRPNDQGTGSRPDTSAPSTDQTRPGSTAPTLPDYSQPTGTLLLFSDVREQDWFRAAVQYVYHKGMMNGTSDTTFAPYATTTRGMIVTILHRLEDSPAAAAAAFTDVSAGAYYAAPVAWASASGIVTGYGGAIFKPDDPITREQLAAILYRYAQYKGVDVSRKNDLLLFSDRAAVSSYAVDAVSWAVDAGLITGIDGRLEPAGYANRAQVATILMRLCENVIQ